ncbi:MAG: hypothetical protein ACK55O_13235 [Phycisphaerales bacterium]
MNAANGQTSGDPAPDATARSMRMVLLRHELPGDGGAFHYDWLIEGPQRIPAPPTPDDRCLVSFRVLERLDLLAPVVSPKMATGEEPAPVEFEARRTPDHRRQYLTYEGPVTGGGGGRVVRVASGVVRAVEQEFGIVRVIGTLEPEDGQAGSGGLVKTWEGVEIRVETNGERVWAFSMTQAPPAPPEPPPNRAARRAQKRGGAL